jgi:hypothetical protein
VVLLCVYLLHRRLAPAVLKTRKKKELETEFQLFWNNINQKVMGYQQKVNIKKCWILIQQVQKRYYTFEKINNTKFTFKSYLLQSNK